jgi:hypothetical protein
MESITRRRFPNSAATELICNTMTSARIFNLISLIGLIFFSACVAAEGQTIRLPGTAWTLSIQPRTLEVIGTPAHGPPITLSSAGADPGPVIDLVFDTHHARWKLPWQKLTIDMRLDNDVLDSEFTSDKTGTVTWPIIKPSQRIRAWIVPLFEGSYIPMDDPAWAAFLVDQGPLDTTGGLSMPFWGLDCTDCTATYILTNQFNNKLLFTTEAGKLAGSLTHTFTSNAKVKQFGCRIHLGGRSPIEPARIYRNDLIAQGNFVSLKQKIDRIPDVAKLPGAAHIYLWGDGLSGKMIQKLHDAGLDRLWLGSGSWSGLTDDPSLIGKAISCGYLIGPYDSFHSIHSPKEADTWETAQFDEQLYENGPVVLEDGTKKTGFKHKGFILSPLAARPAVETRVARLMSKFHCNSWFVDCDATGEVFDDYSPLHPATQAEDMNARLSRLGWIRDTFKVVIGSEGGSSYAAGTIHFAHGMMTPVIGWGDPDLTTRSSPYYLGGYYPPEHPAVFFKQVPMKQQYRHIYTDPRSRLPLYQTVFHDSVVTTHQWGYGSLKFTDDDHARELLELLYSVPPLYHLNLAEWFKRQKLIKEHYDFFSPLHRKSALMPMTDFSWLTPDHLVQRTVFGNRLEMTANFRPDPYTDGTLHLPAQSIQARWIDTGEVHLYWPGN